MHHTRPDVVFDGVKKRFDATLVLEDITLALPARVITAIVGESGSGKSTLLEHINALVRPDAGRVSVFGDAIDYDHSIALRRRIGYAVQSVALFPHLTVKHNISLLADLEEWDAQSIDARVVRLLELLNLPAEVLGRYPHELSGGQRQRVGLCRAMMLNPPLLLLDEPFSGVDPITRQGIHGEFLHSQTNEPRTVVLVTHDMREAVKLAGFMVVLRHGRVLQAATTDRVVNDPADDYVECLIKDQL